MKFQQEYYNLSTLAKHIFLQQILSTLGDKMILKRDLDRWFDLGTVRLQDFWAEKKRVLVLFRNEFFLGLSRKNPKPKSTRISAVMLEELSRGSKIFCLEQTEQISEYSRKYALKGFFEKYNFTIDRWHDTDNASTLVERLGEFAEENLRKRFDAKRKLVVTQAILTNQRDIWNQMKKLYSKGLTSIEKLCRNLYDRQTLSQYLLDALVEDNLDIGSFACFGFVGRASMLMREIG